MLHELKTDPEVFQAVYENKKTFEIRKNDRNFQVGDTLLLRETAATGEEMKPQYAPSMAEMCGGDACDVPGKPLKYTGRESKVTVDYILHGPIYGLADGWCIMSIIPYD